MTPSISSAIAPPLPNVLLETSSLAAARLAAKLGGDLFGAAARELGAGAARALCSSFFPEGAPSPAKAARARASGTGYASAISAAKTTAAKKTSTAKKPTTTKKTTTSTTKAPAGYAFLNDPKLSIEDKLMQLLAKLNEKYKAEMEDHLKRMAGGTASSSSSSSSSGSTSTKKSGGILGGIVSAVSSVVKSAIPAVGVVADVLGDKTVQSIIKTVGGPVLGAAATALGLPALAPLIVKYAPQVVDVIGTVAKGLDTPTQSASKTSSSGTTTGAATSESDEKLELLKFQQVEEKQKSMFELASNVFKSMHDTRSAIIGNMR